MAKQIVIAGLKWPPEVEAQVMMAKAMPMAKPQPIWKMLPKAVTPRGEAPLRVKSVMHAIPGKLEACQ